MKRSIVLPTIIAAGLLCGASLANAGSSPASPPITKVAIADYAFKPATLTVPAGTQVQWTNSDDDPHTVTADDGAFDSHGLGQGDTYKHVFAKPGRYPYHCSAHPFMKGVVIVTKGASGT